MPLYLVQAPFASPFQIWKRIPPTKTSLFPSLETLQAPNGFRVRRICTRNRVSGPHRLQASLLETPVLWAGRLCVFYVLLKAGLAGSESNPIASDLLKEGDDLGFSKWIQTLQGSSVEKQSSQKRKVVSKWHPTTKGTLKRSYRVPSKAVGRKLLKSIASLLSDDDQFIDATSHKGVKLGGRAPMEKVYVAIM